MHDPRESLRVAKGKKAEPTAVIFDASQAALDNETLAEIFDSLALGCRSKPGQQVGRIGFLRQ